MKKMTKLHENTEQFNNLSGENFDRVYVISDDDVDGDHEFCGEYVTVAHDPKQDEWYFFADCVFTRKTEQEMHEFAEGFGYTF